MVLAGRFSGPTPVLLGLGTLLAACQSPLPPPPASPSEDTVEIITVPAEAVDAPVQMPLKHLANRKLAPLPDVPVSARAKCSFRDPTGYRGQLDLQVKDSQVARFSTAITIPKRGECRFDLADFRQTASGAFVTLSHTANSRCTVRMWPEGRRVTVAFTGCPQQCSGDSFDYLWPILVDAKTGRCS